MDASQETKIKKSLKKADKPLKRLGCTAKVYAKQEDDNVKQHSKKKLTPRTLRVFLPMLLSQATFFFLFYSFESFPSLKASRMRTAVMMSFSGTRDAASNRIRRLGSRRRDSRQSP